MRITKLHYVFSFIFILLIGLSAPVFAQKKGRIQKGLATWYGAKYHGKKTTSGEVYNKNGMTAAHPSLPFGTKVRVTNSLTKKSVIVRINDRGPFGNRHRIIDLSEAAARKIKVFQEGEAKVVVEVLSASVWMEEDKNYLLGQVPVTDPANTYSANSLFLAAIQDTFSATAQEFLSAKEIDILNQHLVLASEGRLNRLDQVNAEQFGGEEAFDSRLGRKGINNFLRQMFNAS